MRFRPQPQLERLLSVRSWSIACAWMVFALCAIFVRGRTLSLDQNVPDRLRFHAIPVAVSVLYHGRAHDYTAYGSIAKHFQTPSLTAAELIPWGVVGWVPEHDGTYYWAADDRGMADYVIAAFALFGPAAASLYDFYFFVLALTCVFALVGFWRHRTMTAVWLFVLAGIYSCLAIMPLANISDSTWEPPSLFEPRTLELLALVATIHIGLAAWLTRRWTSGGVLSLVGQVLIFMFCYQARSSLGWEALFITAVNVAAIYFSLAPKHTGNWHLGGPAWLRAVPLAMFLCGFLALNRYEHVVYNPRYFTDMGARTFWHNALMGVGSNPRLAAKYKLGIGDNAVIEAVITDMRANHDQRLTDRWTNANIRNSLGGWVEFNWFEYESAARGLYFEIWRRDFPGMLHGYLIDKPWKMVSGIMYAWRSDQNPQRKLHGAYFDPLALVPLVIVAPGIMLLAGGNDTGILLVPLLILLVFSLIPGLMFYPVPLTMMGTFASLAVLVYSIGVVLVQRLIK